MLPSSQQVLISWLPRTMVLQLDGCAQWLWRLVVFLLEVTFLEVFLLVVVRFLEVFRLEEVCLRDVRPNPGSLNMKSPNPPLCTSSAAL